MSSDFWGSYYGVCTDIGLLLAEVMIHRAAHLALSIASRRLQDHHWPVIRGFSHAPKNHAVCPELRVAGQGYSIILETSAWRDIFLKTVEAAEKCG